MITIAYGSEFGQNKATILFGNTENNKHVKIDLKRNELLTMPQRGRSYSNNEFKKLLDLLKDMVENNNSTVEF